MFFVVVVGVVVVVAFWCILYNFGAHVALTALRIDQHLWTGIVWTGNTPSMKVIQESARFLQTIGKRHGNFAEASKNCNT